MILGLIHTNGGSAVNSGGGGGGFIAIHFSKGYIDDRYITSYGGTASSGQAGAAGVIYLQENNDRKVWFLVTIYFNLPPFKEEGV